MKNNDYHIVLSDDNDYHQSRWYICSKHTMISMSGSTMPPFRIAPGGFPRQLRNVQPPIVGNYYLVIDEDIPHNTRNEGFRTKEEAKIELLIYIA